MKNCHKMTISGALSQISNEHFSTVVLQFFFFLSFIIIKISPKSYLKAGTLVYTPLLIENRRDFIQCMTEERQLKASFPVTCIHFGNVSPVES